MNGYIKIDRGIMDWEWWDDDKVLKLWLTILLLANWEDKKWHGKEIPRGSFWTSIESLSEASGLSIQEVRTALCKLISTGEVTSKATNQGRLITVVKYGDFQDVPDESDKQNGKPTASKVTTTEEYKNKYIWGQGGIHREYC